MHIDAGGKSSTLQTRSGGAGDGGDGGRNGTALGDSAVAGNGDRDDKDLGHFQGPGAHESFSGATSLDRQRSSSGVSNNQQFIPTNGAGNGGRDVDGKEGGLGNSQSSVVTNPNHQPSASVATDVQRIPTNGIDNGVLVTDNNSGTGVLVTDSSAGALDNGNGRAPPVAAKIDCGRVSSQPATGATGATHEDSTPRPPAVETNNPRSSPAPPASVPSKPHLPHDEDASDCPICLEPLDGQQAEGKKVVTTRCNHRFHRACLVRHLGNNNLCPMCRKEQPYSEFSSMLCQKLYYKNFQIYLSYIKTNENQCQSYNRRDIFDFLCVAKLGN